MKWADGGQVREAFLRLPGGVSEAEAVLQLRRRAAETRQAADGLKGLSAPRPVPSQYPALARHVAAFVGGAGAPARLLALLLELQVAPRPSTWALTSRAHRPRGHQPPVVAQLHLMQCHAQLLPECDLLSQSRHDGASNCEEVSSRSCSLENGHVTVWYDLEIRHIDLGTLPQAYGTKPQYLTNSWNSSTPSARFVELPSCYAAHAVPV